MGGSTKPFSCFSSASAFQRGWWWSSGVRSTCIGNPDPYASVKLMAIGRDARAGSFGILRLSLMTCRQASSGFGSGYPFETFLELVRNLALGDYLQRAYPFGFLPS